MRQWMDLGDRVMADHFELRVKNAVRPGATPLVRFAKSVSRRWKFHSTMRL